MYVYQVRLLFMRRFILAISLTCIPLYAATTDRPHAYRTIANQEPQLNDFTHALWVWTTQTKSIGAQELNHFITNLYNNPLYAREYLPNTFNDIERFLSYGNQTYKNRTYMQQVLRLFYNKIKSCRYINPQAFSTLLDALPKLLERHCIAEKPFAGDLIEQKINQCIQSYVQQAAQAQRPSSIPALSKDIITIIDTHYSQFACTTAVEELRNSVQILCELCVSKLVWSPEEGVETWHSTKKIAQQLGRLLEASLLTDADDLNDLFVTLSERYSYFMELMATDLSSDFFTALHNDLKEHAPLFLDFDEQEPSIEPKLIRFNRNLAQAEAMNTECQARQQLERHAQELAEEHGIVMRQPKLITAHGITQLPVNVTTR